MADDQTATVLAEHGLVNPTLIVQAADETGVPTWIAAAVAEKESGGRNLYGNDRGGVYAVGDPERPNPNEVTPENYARFEERVLAGETSNGVGPAQITWPGFIKDAKTRGIRLWIPLENLRYGFALIAGYLGGLDTPEAVESAGLRYNGALAYGVDLAQRAQVWRDRIEGEPDVAVIATTNIGWTVVSPQLSRAKRVGPHTPTEGNGREIFFREGKVADLLAAAMWLTHTGNAGELPDENVYLWHGSRPLDATFGSNRSDHKAQTAMDQNWPDHPWEESIGTAAYNAHMADKRHAAAHKLYAAVQARLVVPGQRPVVRWCGQAWTLPNGAGYPVGYRDCMHWTVENDQARIDAAVTRLHSFFRPPWTKEDIGKLQDIVDVVRDNQWGPASKKAIRDMERAMGITQTGLPGSVAFWNAYNRLFGTTYSGFLPRDIRAAQTLLARAGWYKSTVDGLPGPNFQDSMRSAQEALKAAGLYKDAIDLKPGPNFMTAITKWLSTPTPAPTPTPPPVVEQQLPVQRISGANRFDVFANASTYNLPDGPGLLLAADGTPDVQAATLMAARRPDVDLQLTDARGQLRGVTLAHITATRPGWVLAVGGSATIPDATVRAAMTAAGIK